VPEVGTVWRRSCPPAEAASLVAAHAGLALFWNVAEIWLSPRLPESLVEWPCGRVFATFSELRWEIEGPRAELLLLTDGADAPDNGWTLVARCEAGPERPVALQLPDTILGDGGRDVLPLHEGTAMLMGREFHAAESGARAWFRLALGARGDDV
jgi:hypothetical protein